MLNENKENKEISQKFKNLPDDILFLILSYDNKLKYRNGKWMNQILLEDSRRECIKKMIKPIYIRPVIVDDLEQRISSTQNEYLEKTNRVYVSLKNEKKERIYHCYKINHFYYEYIFIFQGRYIGYVNKLTYLIIEVKNEKGISYNQYVLIDKEP